MTYLTSFIHVSPVRSCWHRCHPGVIPVNASASIDVFPNREVSAYPPGFIPFAPGVIPANDTSGRIYINVSIGVIPHRVVSAHPPGFIPCEPGVIRVNYTSGMIYVNSSIDVIPHRGVSAHPPSFTPLTVQSHPFQWHIRHDSCLCMASVSSLADTSTRFHATCKLSGHPCQWHLRNDSRQCMASVSSLTVFTSGQVRSNANDYLCPDVRLTLFKHWFMQKIITRPVSSEKPCKLCRGLCVTHNRERLGLMTLITFKYPSLL